MREDDALGIACGTAGIQDVGDIIERGFFLQGLHFRLAGKVLT